MAGGCFATPITESPFRWIRPGAAVGVRTRGYRRWLRPEANNGPTVSVDPYGRIVARLPANVRGELDAPYGFRTDLTPYARWGDWLPGLCVIAALVLLLLGEKTNSE